MLQPTSGGLPRVDSTSREHARSRLSGHALDSTYDREDSISHFRRHRLPRRDAVRGVLLGRYSRTASVRYVSPTPRVREAHFGMGPAWRSGNCRRGQRSPDGGRMVPPVDVRTPLLRIRRRCHPGTLCIGVVLVHRRQGIGRALLEQLIATARAHEFPALSLSVNPFNPARVLYESLGFRKVGESGASWTLRLRLDSDAPLRDFVSPWLVTVKNASTLGARQRALEPRARVRPVVLDRPRRHAHVLGDLGHGES
jgi:GNAT superfamily N-acetyltransferase